MSKSSAACLEFEPAVETPPSALNASPIASLKSEAAERLAAHRARRERARISAPHLPGFDPAPQPTPETRAARIAASVAARYAHSQTYRAFLAAEAERAIEQAHAVAAVAARNAEAVVATQQQLLSELAEWETPEPQAPAEPASYSTPGQGLNPPEWTVRLFQQVVQPRTAGTANAVLDTPLDEDDLLALDAEIAFRQAPVFDAPLEPAIPLPANVIEFPRQLVATRKARPRLAEGPLRDEAAANPESHSAQLRIFEVEPEHISTTVASETAHELPEWSSIRLSACVPGEPVADANSGLAAHTPLVLQAAPIELRLMATAVDAGLIIASFLAFATLAARTAGQLPGGLPGLLAAAGSLLILAIVYHLLFFSLAEATPGMRYARIGLCTFEDDNPTRRAMRRRLAAVALAASPLGLGLLWAFVDEDGLGWHDRISRTYQRSY